METTLIILRGNSGSGKTTVAQRLQKALGDSTLLVSQDVVRREMLSVRDRPDNLSIELIAKIARYGEKKVETVIVEGILRADFYGQMLNLLMADFERSFCYYFDVTFEETLRRHQMKSKAHEFGAEQMKVWWQENDFLGVTGEKRLSESQTVEGIVRSIVRDLKRE